MNNPPSNGRYRNVPNSQEPTAAKDKVTYLSALRAAGFDEVFYAKRLMELAQAQERRWNPKKGSWEKVDDYATQLAAMREIAKICDIYPKEDSDDSRAPVRIDISAIPKRRELATETEPVDVNRNW